MHLSRRTILRLLFSRNPAHDLYAFGINIGRELGLTEARAGAPRCIACPDEVRDLFATAYNACGEYERGDEPRRLRRKMTHLRESVTRLQPAVNDHFRGGPCASTELPAGGDASGPAT